MTAQEPFDLGQFLASFKNFMDKAVEQARVEEPETLFLSKLRTHFGTDPIHLPTVRETFEKAGYP